MNNECMNKAGYDELWTLLYLHVYEHVMDYLWVSREDDCRILYEILDFFSCGISFAASEQSSTILLPLLSFQLCLPLVQWYLADCHCLDWSIGIHCEVYTSHRSL